MDGAYAFKVQVGQVGVVLRVIDSENDNCLSAYRAHVVAGRSLRQGSAIIHSIVLYAKAKTPMKARVRNTIHVVQDRQYRGVPRGRVVVTRAVKQKSA